MKTLVSAALVMLVLTLFVSRTVHASSDNFKTTADISYIVATDGLITVTHTITIENLTTELYVDKFTLKVTGTQPINPHAKEDNKNLLLLSSNTDDSFELVVTLDPVVGLGKTRDFEIVFETSDFAFRSGSVWEIAIPGEVGNNVYDVTSIVLYTPSEFGKPAYISPSPTKQFQSADLFGFKFISSDVPQNGLTAAFGEFQMFDFNLSYHLENPLTKTSDYSIAIPPDTTFQRVLYKVIDPKPSAITRDDDGNWLAQFTLKAREKIDIQVTGVVEIYSQATTTIPKQDDRYLDKLLAPSIVWQTTDTNIQSLANRLKTPKAIYDYVTAFLSYDYTKIRPNVARLGAVDALANPTRSICTEYTDLFVALSRAAGIPAREVNGFAYTQNPNIEPLSLVADVLHAWPEYWDKDKSSWVQVDPTWGSTSKGTDFFTKLDLRHFTFVVHGLDYQKPYPPGSYKLGPNPQKDVYVALTQASFQEFRNSKIDFHALSNVPWADAIVELIIENTGNVAMYDEDLQVLFDDKVVSIEKLAFLAPYAKYHKSLKIPFSFFAKSTPKTITVVFGIDSATFPTYETGVKIVSILATVLPLVALSLIWLKKRS